MPSFHSSTPPVVVIAPDSFKGSLSAEQVAEAIAGGIRRARADAVIRIVPMADGGERTFAAIGHGNDTGDREGTRL
ncbi:glycerate kinase, partial [Caballeronia sp. M23-90]